MTRGTRVKDWENEMFFAEKYTQEKKRRCVEVKRRIAARAGFHLTALDICGGYSYNLGGGPAERPAMGALCRPGAVLACAESGTGQCARPSFAQWPRGKEGASVRRGPSFRSIGAETRTWSSARLYPGPPAEGSAGGIER